ncbi:heterokaryon incompatibility protein-domain-containing protein [Hypoxylon sp. NC1633]|nr:heterokaryon incompatibility protein-domain-containing protein [Hypoxylon sp. NC1633]
MNEEFCQQCRHLFELDNIRKISGRSYRHSSSYRHGNAEAVVENARKGCPFCYLIIQLQTKWSGDVPIEHFVPIKGTEDNRVSVRVLSQGVGSLIGDIEIEVEDDNTEDPASALTSFRPVETEVASQTVVAAARELISQCNDSHPACRAEAGARPPARVVDVAGPDTSVIRLCSPPNLIEEGYVVLSYCWGKHQPVQLRKDNLAIFMDGFSLASLPPTFQDAVTCTRALGYRYLWVDALCILQDDDEGKMHEIKNMGSIYRNATVSISAAVTSSVLQSYLDYDRRGSIRSAFKYSESKTKSCHIKIKLEDGRIGTLTIVPRVHSLQVTGHWRPASG